MEEYQRDRLGIDEYNEVLMDSISKVVINRNYIAQNQEFWDNMVFKLFEEYYYSKETISIRSQARSIEIFFNCLFAFQPSTEKPLDILDL